VWEASFSGGTRFIKGQPVSNLLGVCHRTRTMSQEPPEAGSLIDYLSALHFASREVSETVSAPVQMPEFRAAVLKAMRYWWVNHRQTFRHEFKGRYIWSPKRKRDGARNRFYDFLREVAPGDVVFSYADGQIRGAGFANSYCYTCPRPAEFGHIGDVWDVVG
jgi:hypothetical protein